MLLKVDAAQLEWRVKVFLAQDKLGMWEIQETEAGRFDTHTDNQTKFHLPSRLVAKTFVYRMIFADAFGEKGYRGPAYAYANDAVFAGTSTSITFWEEVVTRFFEKYEGVHKHSVDLIHTATVDGKITVPSGRFFPFKPEPKWHGGLDWPRTKILNYPVQGFSADLVQVARLRLWQEIKDNPRVLLINTVHDDIELDIDNDPELCYTICILLEDCFRQIPKDFEMLYGSSINVPMAGEVKYGLNLNEAHMHKFKKETFFEDWKKLYG